MGALWSRDQGLEAGLGDLWLGWPEGCQAKARCVLELDHPGVGRGGRTELGS